MKKIAVSKLEAMIGRIDSREKAGIAEQFIFDCELTEDELDKLMQMIESKYRELEEEEYKNLSHRRGTHLPWNRNK